MLVMCWKWADNWAFVCPMSKMEEVKKKTCLQVRKKKNQLTITGGDEVVGKHTEKWKGGDTFVKVFKNNKDRKKRKSKRDKMD